MSRKSEIEKIHRSIEIRFYLGFDPNVRHVPRQNNKSARLCNATIFFCRKAPLFFEEFWHKCTKSTTALALHIEKTRCMIVARMFTCAVSIYWHQRSFYRSSVAQGFLMEWKCFQKKFGCRKAPLFFEEFWQKCTKSTTALALHIEKSRCMIVARMFTCSISIYWHQRSFYRSSVAQWLFDEMKTF